MTDEAKCIMYQLELEEKKRIIEDRERRIADLERKNALMLEALQRVDRLRQEPPRRIWTDTPLLLFVRETLEKL